MKRQAEWPANGDPSSSAYYQQSETSSTGQNSSGYTMDANSLATMYSTPEYMAALATAYQQQSATGVPFIDSRKICRFFQTGSCRYGLNCLYRHEFFPFASSAPCKFFNTPKGCKNGDACFFMHQRPDKKPRTEYVASSSQQYIDPTQYSSKQSYTSSMAQPPTKASSSEPYLPEETSSPPQPVQDKTDEKKGSDSRSSSEKKSEEQRKDGGSRDGMNTSSSSASTRKEDKKET
jgi:hypothetical protein